MVATLALVPALMTAIAVIARQLRLNAESKRKYELARYVFDQSGRSDVLADVADMTRAERPPVTIGWKPTQTFGSDQADSSG